MPHSRSETGDDPTEDPLEPRTGQLWPAQEYAAQIARLRAAIGQRIYLVEMVPREINPGVRQTGEPHVLLDLLDLPRPEPAQGLAPHLLLLDDGRGVNLGRVARVSVGRAFDPPSDAILYSDPDALQGLLFAEPRLSPAFIAGRSRALLGRRLGKGPTPAGPEPQLAERPAETD